MSANNKRKCAKCGKTRAQDMTVTYHRFPNPGIDNITRARAWAKYCWPNEDWNSVDLLRSLHTKNKVLCGRHFKINQFCDTERQKLSKFAVPEPSVVEKIHSKQETIPQMESDMDKMKLKLEDSCLQLRKVNLPHKLDCQKNTENKADKLNEIFDQNQQIMEEITCKENLKPHENEFVECETTDSNADHENMCKICLTTYEDSNYLLPELIFKDFIEKIYTCFKIVLNVDKSLSLEICTSCIEALNVAYEFRLKCLSFEERFTTHCEVNINKPVEESKIDIDSPSFIEDITNTASVNKTDVKLEKYKCTICNKILKSLDSLLRHRVSMHKKRKPLGKVTGCGESRRYHCTKCAYHTPHRQTLVNHMRRHNGERPYRCECGKSFTQSSSLAAHRKTHSATTYYTCATCGKQFKHAFTLKKHLQVHEPGKYCCDICHKTLKSAQSLQDHKHRHYNIKNYNCEDCGDTFVTCSELLNHKKKHNSVKEIGCQLCSYKTHTKKNLVIHLKRHAGDKSIKCSLCELTFYTSGDLRRHHRVHTREKPFACPACAQRFAHSTSLNKHVVNLHGLHYKWVDFKLKDLKRNKSVQFRMQKDDEQ